MNKKTRRLIFILGVIIFIIVAPVFVAYSIGYNLNIFKFQFQQTGGLFIKSEISDITISVNGQEKAQTSFFSSGALISNLLPGKYYLRIEKDGYRPWTKVFEVKPLLVTEFRNILLAADSPAIATATPDEIVSLSPRASASSTVILKNGNLIETSEISNKILASEINSYSYYPEEVLFISDKGFLGRIDTTTRDITIIGRPGFYLKGQKPSFYKSPNADEFAILDSSGGLFLYKRDGSLIALEGGVQKVGFGKLGKRLLITKKNSIEIYWLEDNIIQPFQKAGSEEEIYSSDDNIKDAAWFQKDDAHIAVLVGDKIIFAETDIRGGKNIFTLAQYSAISEISTNEFYPNDIFFKSKKIYRKIEMR